ncbi:hypothetical protein I2750_19690 [Bacillus sp. PR5]|nr:hypothetical protein [Bacillus sp. PR5]
MSSPVLDLSTRAFYYVRGDITLIGTWLRVDGQFRPCMVLIRTGEEKNEYTVPCLIPLERAWIWNEMFGDPRQAARTVAGFIDALRLTPGRFNAVRLLSLIHDHLGDLVTMPPLPPLEQSVVAEFLVTDNTTGKTREVEVKDYV